MTKPDLVVVLSVVMPTTMPPPAKVGSAVYDIRTQRGAEVPGQLRSG